MIDYPEQINNTCKTTTEALNSDLWYRVLKLTLEKCWVKTKEEIQDILSIFSNIINYSGISIKESEKIEKIFIYERVKDTYNSIINNLTTSEDINILETINILKLIEFSKIEILLRKMITKNKIINTINTDSSVKRYKSDWSPEKLYNRDNLYTFKDYCMLDHKIYYKIWADIYKTTFEEKTELFTLTDWKFKLIKDIPNPEELNSADFICHGSSWNNIIWLYTWHYWENEHFKWLNYIFWTKDKKILELEERDVKLISVYWKKIYIQYLEWKWLLIPNITNLDRIKENIIENFHYNKSEYFIEELGKWKFNIFSEDNWYSTVLVWNNDIKELNIDRKKWTISSWWYNIIFFGATKLSWANIAQVI